MNDERRRFLVFSIQLQLTHENEDLVSYLHCLASSVKVTRFWGGI